MATAGYNLSLIPSSDSLPFTEAEASGVDLAKAWADCHFNELD